MANIPYYTTKGEKAKVIDDIIRKTKEIMEYARDLPFDKSRFHEKLNYESIMYIPDPYPTTFGNQIEQMPESTRKFCEYCQKLVKEGKLKLE